MIKKSCNLKKLFVFLILAFPVSEICSLDFRFERIDVSAGLAGNSVSGIVQDKRGFIWFATQDGLSRYDGSEFRLFEHEPFNRETLGHNLIQTIFYDPEEDKIWLGTYGGLSVFDPATEVVENFFPVESSEARKILEDGIITAVEKDREGFFWIGSLGGLVRFSPSLMEAVFFSNSPDDPHSLPDNTVRDLLCDSEGKIWIATYNGISLYENNRFNNFITSETLPDNGKGLAVVMTLSELSPGKLIFATWGGHIGIFDTETKKHSHTWTGENRFYTLMIDRRGRIWAGAWGEGLFMFEKAENIEKKIYAGARNSHDNKYSLSNDIVYSIFQDSFDLVWIGTNGGGVNKLNLKQKDYRYIYSTEKSGGIRNDRYKSIMAEDEDVLWIGSYNSGLYIYDEREKRARNFTKEDGKNSVSDNTVNCIYKDKKGRVWVLTNSGVNLYDRERNLFFHYFIDSDNRIRRFANGIVPGLSAGTNQIFYSVAEDLSGRLWLGTYSRGIYVWDPETGETLNFNEGSPQGERISNNLVFSLVRDLDGYIWAGTNYGLNRYDPETGRARRYYHNPGDPYSLSHNNVRVLYCDSAGNVWAGTTGGGVARIEPEMGFFYNFGKIEGLDHNTVTGITEDRGGNLIIVTLRGISMIERKPENKFTTAISLGYHFGVKGVDFRGGLTRDSSGNIYAAAAGEIYKFDTSFYYSNTIIPEIVITDLEIFDKSYIDVYGRNIFAEDEITLHWEEDHISFRFASLDYTFPTGKKYRYILEGYDKGWIYSDERNFASYTGIPPGRYTFRVTGTNSSGMWSTREASVRLRIKPPFYRTPLAYMIYLAAAAAFFYGIVMIVRGKEAEKQLSEVNRLKDELLNANLLLDRQSRTDALTGVHNRKHFNEVLGNVWDLYSRTGVNFSILMLDIDYFKEFNDRYGHLAGDRCLCEVASLISDAVARKTDSVFRYGGEEFVVILVDTDTKGAKFVAEKIRKKIMEKKIPNESAFSGTGFLTISIGVAGTEVAKPESPDHLLLKADKNLYRAKGKGRNCVV